MAKVTTVRVPGSARPDPGYSSLVLTVLGKRLRRLVMPWMPDEIEYSNLARAWEAQARPGRSPLMLDTGGPLAVLSFTVRLIEPEAKLPVTGMIDELKAVAAKGRAVIVTVGPRPIGLCNITGLNIIEREADRSGGVLDAEASIELTTVSYAPTSIGPVKSGVRRVRGRARDMARRRA